MYQTEFFERTLIHRKQEGQNINFGQILRKPSNHISNSIVVCSKSEIYLIKLFVAQIVNTQNHSYNLSTSRDATM